MPLHLTKYIALLGLALSLSACGGGGGGSDSSSATNPGAPVPPAPIAEEREAVHFVKLATIGDQPNLWRQIVTDSYNTCVTAFNLRGAPGAPLPLDLPAIVNPVEIEIYYGAHRTVYIDHRDFTKFNPDNCAKIVEREENMRIQWNGGKCEVDLTRRRAAGSCSDAALRASESTPLRPPSSETPTGERRTIQGLMCNVYQVPATPAGTDNCFADISKTPSGEALNPYPFTPAFMTLTIRGLLLESRSSVANLRAQDVRLNTSVPKAMFKIPADFDRSGVLF